MKKSITTIALAAAMLIPTLSACSGDSKKDDKGSASSSSSTGASTGSKESATSSGNGDSMKDGAVDASAFSLPASDKYKLDDGGNLSSITGDSVFSTQGNFAFLGKNTMVVNEGSNNYKSNVYRGVKLSDGSQAWRLDVSLPEGVKDLKADSFDAEQMGNTLLVHWAGTTGGDALNEAKVVSYLQQFNLDTGKKVDEVKIDGEASYKAKGLGRYLIPVEHGDNASVKVFYPSGTAMEPEEDKVDSYDGKQALLNALGSGSGGRVNVVGSPWVTHTAPGKGFMVYSRSSDENILRAVDTKAGKFIGPETKAKDGSNLEGTSLTGEFTSRFGVVINAADPTKMSSLANALKTDLSNVSLDDRGNVLGTAAATGDPYWVYANSATKQVKILDKGDEDSSAKAYLSNGYIVKETTVKATDEQGKLLWTGNILVSKVKGVAAQ